MSKTYFISGHRDITKQNFLTNYVPKLFKAIEEGASFVVGDCKGVDSMAQDFLLKNGIKDVIVYHMYEHPQYNAGFTTRGGYLSDVDRDFTMILCSDEDIAWVAPGRKRSGTGQNIERRKWINERKQNGLPIDYKSLIKREANNFL